MTERAAFFLKLSFAPATLALAARAWEAIAAIVFEVRWWKVCLCGEECADSRRRRVCQASRDHRFCGGVAASWRRSQSEANIRVKLWLAKMLKYTGSITPVFLHSKLASIPVKRTRPAFPPLPGVSAGHRRHLPPSRRARRTAPPSVFRGATEADESRRGRASDPQESRAARASTLPPRARGRRSASPVPTRASRG